MIYILILLALIVLILIFLKKSKTTPAAQKLNLREKNFMTASEIGFYKILRSVAGPLNVAPQVSMSALITNVGKNSRADRNRFDRKTVDFVLFDDGGQVHLIVELDDPTHMATEDELRDRMTASVGYKTLRLRNPQAKDAEAIRSAIAAVLLPSTGKPVLASASQAY